MVGSEGLSWCEARVRVAGANLGITTAWPREPVADTAALNGIYRELGARLRSRGQVQVHEKAFGPLEVAPALAEARRAALAGPGAEVAGPLTFIEGRPCLGGVFAGLQAWSVEAGQGVRVEPAGAEGVEGRLVTTAGGRLLFLSALNGGHVGSSEPAPAVELRGMFERAERLLAHHGFTFRDTARTWLFVDRLLEVYDDLNRVRSAFFRERGLIEGSAPAFLPASTGIQGRHPSRPGCTLDLLALQVTGSEACLHPLRSPRQDAAFHYGSAFSRGMRVGGGPDPALLLISGTASIARDGRSLYIGDAQGQIAETLLDASAVLKAGGARFADVVSAIRYHKHPATWQTHVEMRELGLLPDLPGIDVLADVCRDELLFELEAVAVC